MMAIIVVFLLNSAVILVGFGVLQNQINDLKTEESDLSEVPAPTEPVQLQEPEPEPTPEPEPQLTPEPEPEPEPTEPTHKLMAPVANLSLASWRTYNGFSRATIEGDITNPNNSTIYFVKINLTFFFNEVRGPIILGERAVEKTIRVGTLKPNKPITIDESYDFQVSDTSGLALNGFSYHIDWVE